MIWIGGVVVFGYVRTMTPELKVKEHEYYRGTYCGLCRAMGKCTGQCSRLSLNYDFVMFALLRFALSKEQTSFSQKRCALHLIKKRNIMNRNAELDRSAYVSALLCYHKVKDDIADEKFWGRLSSRIFLLPTASKMRKKAIKKGNCAELDNRCAEILAKISELEKDTSLSPSVDLPAKAFGTLLGELISEGYSGNDKRIAYSIGLHLGKWIYIADALDDLEEDEINSRYNPFLRLYGTSSLSEEQANGIQLALKNELIELEAALDLIDFGSDPTVKNLIYNIIYLGMPKRIEEITEKFKKDNNRKDNL